MNARKMNVRVEEISHCGECPFLYVDETDGDGADEWRCTSDENEDHDGYRLIQRVQPKEGGRWPPPPNWCPLRNTVHVVTFKPPGGKP